MTTGFTPSISFQFDPGRETLSNVNLVRRIHDVRDQFDSSVNKFSCNPEWRERIRWLGLAIMSGSLRTVQQQIGLYKEDADGLNFVCDSLNSIFPSAEVGFEVGYVPGPKGKYLPIFAMICKRDERLLAIGSDEWYGVHAFATVTHPVPRRESIDEDIKTVYKQLLAAIEPQDPGPPPFVI